MSKFRVGQKVIWIPNENWRGEVTKVSQDQVCIHWEHPWRGKKAEPTVHPSSRFHFIKTTSNPVLESPPEDGEWE